MPRLFAFLRAINVGGRNVTMERLRRLFAAQGFARVETFIASGNVVFEAAAADVRALERDIEDSLRAGLGYEVATFIRTEAELAAVAAYKPFPQAELDAAAALNVAFLHERPDAATARNLLALRTARDDFRVRGREVYWLCRTRQSESVFSNAVLERALGLRSTMRGANTIRRLAAKYCDAKLSGSAG
ncbi:MAG TPA: DUF1697 domain-containing protein [Pyrinomonadaceae bacterium]